MGDKIVINTAPTISVSNYTVGGGVNYQVPTPDVQELIIDKGKYFAFQINDVLEYQAKPDLMDMFAADAAELFGDDGRFSGGGRRFRSH